MSAPNSNNDSTQPQAKDANPKPRIYTRNDPEVARLHSGMAVAIGLNESILLLQLDYWISATDLYRDGCWWTYQSTRKIHQKFPFWGVATIHRIVQSLVKQELIFVANYNKRPGDKTQWFALNHKRIQEIPGVHIVLEDDKAFQNGTARSKMEQGAFQNGTTLPKNTLTKDSHTEYENTSAPNGAGAPKPKPREPVFDLIALEVFGIDSKNMGNEGGRVGIISNWLLAKNDGGKRGLGKLEVSQPVDDVRAFIKHYRQSHPRINLPRDITKFSEAYLAWMRLRAGSKPKDTQAEKAAAMGLSPEEYEEARAKMNALQNELRFGKDGPPLLSQEKLDEMKGKFKHHD